MKKLFLILLACVLFAAACGDDDPVETSDASDSASAADDDMADDEMSDDDMADDDEMAEDLSLIHI